MKIITHDGLFHAHEVFAIALTLNKYPNKEIKIVRTRDPEIITNSFKDGAWIVDVGLKMEPENYFIDHHVKKGWNGNFASMYFKGTYENIDINQRRILDGVAKIDCGIGSGENIIGSMIASFYPTWNEKNPDENQAFLNAVDLAKNILKNADLFCKIYDNRMKGLAAKKEARIFLKDIIEKSENILILPHHLPWLGSVLEENENREKKDKIMFIVFKRGENDYMVQSVPLNQQDFTNHGDVVCKKDEFGCIFKHKDGFIASFTSKTNAVCAAQNSVFTNLEKINKNNHTMNELNC